MRGDWEIAYYWGAGFAAGSWHEKGWLVALVAGVFTMLIMRGILAFRRWSDRAVRRRCELARLR